MSASTHQIGRYTGVPVAEGGFATVYRAVDPGLGIPVALKKTHAGADPATVASLHHEFCVLGEFDCAQLPRALDFGWADGCPCVVTDWIGGPELWEHPQAQSAEFFVTTLRQIARVLMFIHHRGWVHGDLKPGNFRWGFRRALLGNPAPSNESPSVLYLLDFGLARRSGDTERPRGAGTVGYYAPEFLKRLPADGRADWYSVGAMLYEWLYGRRPFAAEDPADEIAGHLEQVPDTNDHFVRPAPGWARDLTLRLLSKTADQRGKDIYDLLQWMSQFDQGLSPDAILNEQATEHHSSECRRLDAHDAALIEQITRSASSLEETRWAIRADEAARERLTRGLVTTILESGFACGSGHEDSAFSSWVSGYQRDSAGQLRLCADKPSHAGGVLLVDFIPISTGETHACAQSLPARVFASTLLPWDPRRVADHLLGFTRDEALARRFAESIWGATGGLPGVVADVLAHAISSGQLNRVDNRWSLDDTAISSWQASPAACVSFDEYLGPMTADEHRLFDWLSVGRSRVPTGLLRELSNLPSERCDAALESLVARGVVIQENPNPATGHSEVRFRFGGLSEVWRAHLPGILRRSYATLLADKMANGAIPTDRRRQEVLAECFADARQWEECANHSVAAANLNVKIERHEDAWRFIGLAQSASQQIHDLRVRAHWLGRALMARGDYQKSVGQIDEALRSYREILALGRRHGDHVLLAETLKDLGDLYKVTRQFEKGVRVLRRAWQLWEAIGNRNEAARTLNNLGNMFWVASDRSQARRYYEQALDLARALQTHELIALILSNLGVAYKGDRDYPRAEAYYRESLAIKEKLNVPVETARTLNNLGVIAFDRGHLVEASEYLERASNLNLRAGAAAEILCNRGMLIHVALERGDLRSVIQGSLSALGDAESLGDVATGAELRGLLAEAYTRAGDFHLSSDYLEEAREQAFHQRNDDLTAHLGLVAAVRLWHLGQKEQAVATLDEIEPYLGHSELPRLPLDALVLRMRAAVSRQDVELIERLWSQGRKLAVSVGADHKLAQLAFACLPEDPSVGYSREVARLARESLRVDDRFHWTGAFKMWEARRLMTEQDIEGAGRSATDAVARLRNDGNWEMLWKALVVSGQIEVRRADYEPALTAFDEAAHILNEIGKTIDNPPYRASYLSHPLAKMLSDARAQILELTR